MSDADRRKWNDRYAQSARGQIHEPSALLVQWLPRLPRGRALDIACGAGRNALYLAEAGYRVDAVDIAGQGLALAADRARALNHDVNWLEHDLDEGLPTTDAYQLIVMIDYVNGPLLAALDHQMATGGYLVVEQHLRSDEALAGPRSPQFRVAPGELAGAVAGLDIVFHREGLQAGTGGSLAAKAWLVARKPDRARG